MAPSDIGRTGARFGARPARHTPDPEHPHGRPAADARPADPAPEPVAEENLIGLTGARFGGHSARRRRTTRRERVAARERDSGRPGRDAVDGSPDAARAGVDTGTETGAGTDSDTGTGADTGAGTDTGTDTETVPLPVVGGVTEPAPRVAFAAVRPYVITGGRTRVRKELRLETLVSASPVPGPVPELGTEKATVLSLCAQTRSVSEIAALAGVPLGVARVLIDDLAGEGRLTVHGVSSAEDGPSMELMDRVLSGLRNL